MWILGICFIAALPIRSLQFYFSAKLQLLWREWLSKSLITDYLDDRTYYILNPNDESRNPIAFEETQWWFLCTLGALSPILNDQDLKSLKNESFWKGCYSGIQLPFDINESSPDLWLNNLVSMMNIEHHSENFDGEREDGLVGLQILIHQQM